MSPNVAGAGSSWGLYFFSFNFFKSTLKDYQHVETLSAGSHLVAGALAGIYETKYSIMDRLKPPVDSMVCITLPSTNFKDPLQISRLTLSKVKRIN